MPARFGIRMAAFFLLLCAHFSAAKSPGPLPTVTLTQIAQQRTVVAQALQASKDQQQKTAAIEKRLNGDEASEQAGQAASSDQIKSRLDDQAQLLGRIEAEQNQAAQDQTSAYFNTQNQIIATQVDSQQELKQVQGQIDVQRQNVAQLAQTIQTQRATNIESPILEDALEQYQLQKDRLDQLESLKENLAVQAAQTQMAGDLNQTQNSTSAKATAEDLQNQYNEAEKSYQQLQESYQLALAKDESERKKSSDLDDEYQIEKQKQIALDDTYSHESQKLSQMSAGMLTDFSKQ